MTADLSATLEQRRSVHGDFTDHAAVTQALKDIARAAPSWARMSPVAREAIDMILHKVGRACAGNPDHADHWHDIGGYARLVEERLP
ncbi:hypothetical protein [uncultured Enterovirga sp.]|uniref:hypothetical protein n=1 Tax=uncultured Enterovirga sp. TaxID=2026352 RepID=UPI0035CAF9A1